MLTLRSTGYCWRHTPHILRGMRYWGLQKSSSPSGLNCLGTTSERLNSFIWRMDSRKLLQALIIYQSRGRSWSPGKFSFLLYSYQTSRSPLPQFRASELPPQQSPSRGKKIFQPPLMIIYPNYELSYLLSLAFSCAFSPAH